MAFVVFKSKQISLRFKDKGKYKTWIQYLLKNLDFSDKGINLLTVLSKADIKNIIPKKVILEDDLIWYNVGKSKLWANIKRIITFFIVIIVSLTLLSPVTAINTLTPLRDTIAKKFEDISLIYWVLST